MTNIILPIQDLDYSVLRPTVFSVVKQLMNITEISSLTPVRMHSGDDRALQKNTAINEETTSWNKFPNDDNVTIEITEDFEVDRILSTPVKDPENLIIFRDDQLGIMIKPVYGISNITINVKYRATDKHKADNWRNMIKTKASMGRDVNLHEITYSYQLPLESVEILKQIHKLRENIEGYNQEFDEYLSRHLTTRATTVSNSNGNSSYLAISEKQIRIQGLFDFTGISDKAEKEGEANAYATSFTYKFTYDKPIHCNMVYPIVIHNQVLPKKYRCMQVPYTFDNKQNTFSQSALAFNHFEDSKEILKHYGNKGLDIPAFDNGFFPNSIASSTARICTVLCTITPANKKLLFNLNELGDFSLNKELLDFMLFDKNHLTKTYGSIFGLHLYENNNIQPSNSLSIDGQLNVYSNTDLDLRKTYRVRLFVVVNIDNLSAITTSRIKQYVLLNPKFGIRLANAINSILKDIGSDPDVKSNRLDIPDLKRLGILPNNINYSLDPTTNPLYDPNMIHQKLVELFFIQIERK
jgi:hypothetical protein